jgi:hypothetical protein
MVFFLLGSAWAGVVFDESELQDMCVTPGTCLAVVGEVIDAGCRSSTRSNDGVVTREFTATIEVIEGAEALPTGHTFTLHTSSQDYSDVDPDLGLPGCTIYDPGHPVGEIARYYLNPSSTNGVYHLYQSETFFHLDHSDPDDEPLCAAMEDWDPYGADGPSSGPDETKGGGCSVVPHPKAHMLWWMALVGLAIRSRQRP